MVRMEIVIAGSYQEYLDYLRRSGKSPREAIYACQERHVRGRRGAKIVRVGQSWLNPLTKHPYLHVLDEETQSAGEEKGGG